MTTNPDTWVYGDFAPDPHSRDLPGLKARWLLERLPGLAAPVVLDYGAGEGKHLRLVRSVRPQARLIGVDIRAAHSALDFEFHQLPADGTLPLATESCDVVISCDVLEHVASIEQSLVEIHRVLRKGGAFIGFVPAEGGPGPHALFRLLDRNIYRDTKDHNHAYTRRELRDLFSSRFRIVHLGYSYHLIGATLDAIFFAGFKLPGLGPKLESFWRGQENPFYRGQAATLAKRTFASRLAGLGNRAAYYESRLLKDIAFGAKGLHFHLQKQ